MPNAAPRTAERSPLLCCWRAVVPVVALLLADARTAGAQPADTATAPRDSARPRAAAPRSVCFRPRPAPACRGFWVVEAGVYPRLAGSEAVRPWGARRQLGNHVSWELGYMANMGRHAAVGGAAFAGSNSAEARWGAKARVRRWLPGEFAVDVGAGPVSAVAAVPVAGTSPIEPGFARGAGATADLGLSYRGVVGVAVRGDAVRAGGTTARALHAGVQLGSGAAVGGTVGAALALAVMFGALAYGAGG